MAIGIFDTTDEQSIMGGSTYWLSEAIDRVKSYHCKSTVVVRMQFKRHHCEWFRNRPFPVGSYVPSLHWQGTETAP